MLAISSLLVGSFLGVETVMLLLMVVVFALEWLCCVCSQKRLGPGAHASEGGKRKAAGGLSARKEDWGHPLRAPRAGLLSKVCLPHTRAERPNVD